MISPVENNDIDTFICYRNNSRHIARALKNAMADDRSRDYGKVWYSSSQSRGNYLNDIDPLLDSAERVLIVINEGFTYGFIENGVINDDPSKEEVRITIKELQKIEELREVNEIKIYTVNVDGKSLSKDDVETLVKVLKHSPNVKASEEEIRDAWTFTNVNNFPQDIVTEKEEVLAFFESRLADELKLRLIEPKEELTFFDQKNYREMFYQLITEKEKYPNIAYFGYAGGVFFNNLFTGAFGYQNQNSKEYAHKSIRILLRDPVIEAKEEREQEISFARRPRKKSQDMLTLYEKSIHKNEGIRIEVRFYSHTPYLKGAIFCDENWNPKVGLINFESAYGEDYKKNGGSPFKGIDSDMVYFNGDAEYSASTIKALTTLLTQFNYDWENGKRSLTQEEVNSPLHLKLDDIYYPLVGELRGKRECARAIILNDLGEVALHHVHRNDKYGDSIYYELPGGGIEMGEEPFEGLEREAEEECGFLIERLAYLGDASDCYNLARRSNHHYFFLCRLKGEVEKHFESEGDGNILETVFVPLKEAVSIMEAQRQGGFEGLVRQRELPFLKLAYSLYQKEIESK